MDFNDSLIFSNGQLTFDSNISQNNYLQNYDDSHMIQYFINDVNETSFDSISNVVRSAAQCEQPSTTNVVCSNHQSLNNSLGPLDQSVHSSLHHNPPQRSLQNRSHNSNTNHHSDQQTIPQFHHNQQSTSSESRFIPTHVDQQITYVNLPDIPNKSSSDKSIVYLSSAELVNNQQHYNISNNSNCVYGNSVKKELSIYNLNNSITKDNSFHLTNSIDHNQSNRSSFQCAIPNQTEQLHNVRSPDEQSFSNNLSPINKNELMSPDLNHDFFQSSPSNYHNTSQQTVTDVQANFSSKTTNHNNSISSSNLITSSLSHVVTDIQSENKQSSTPHCKHVINSIESTSNRCNSCKLTDTKIDDSSIKNDVDLNSIIIDPHQLTSPKICLDHQNQKKELDHNSTNASNLHSSQKQQAETKTVIIFRVVDQVLLDGEVVQETIVKSDELVRHTGWIDWPPNKEKQSIASNSPSTTPNISGLSCAQNNDIENATTSSCKLMKRSGLKKSTNSNTKTLKRSVGIQNDKTHDQPSHKEKKVKFRNQTAAEFIAKNNESVELFDPKSVQTANTVNAKIVNGVQSEAIISHSIKGTNLTKDVKVVKNFSIELPILSPSSSSSNQSSEARFTSSSCNLEDPIFKLIEINQKVLAKWTDKNYYPGTIVNKANDGKWLVSFDDGGRRLVRESEIICVQCLPKGQQVMVGYANGFVAKGIVQSNRFESTSDQTYYSIEYFVGSESLVTEYNGKDVFLTGEHAQSLLNRRKQNSKDSKFADVDLNNIIPKRSRISLKPSTNDTLNDGLSSNNFSPSESSNKFCCANELSFNIDSNSNLSSSTINSSTNNNTIAIKKSSRKGKSPSVKQHNSLLTNENVQFCVSTNLSSCPTVSSSDDTKLADRSSDINSQSVDLTAQEQHSNNSRLICSISKSSLFENIAFLLCFEDEKDSSRSQVAENLNPSDIDHLRELIKSGSGLILQNFEDIKQENNQVVLVSHSHHQTVKYFMCLSSGILCIRPQWIIDSCKKNQLLEKEDYLLPTGFSILTNNLLQDRTIYKKSQNLFKGTKIYLVFVSAECELSEWLPLFKVAGAILLDSLPHTTPSNLGKSSFVDLVVSDVDCPSEIAKKASKLKIPIVSINYIIECLIHGRRLPTDAHETFHHTFTSSSRLPLSKMMK